MKFNELSQELQELWTRGVDHNVFNLEWARMGGFAIDAHGKLLKFYKIEISRTDGCVRKMYIFTKMWDDKQLVQGLIYLPERMRMATPSECAEAGVVYVPFMGWRDIESVPDDVDVFLDVDEYSGIVGKKESHKFYSEQVKSPCGYPYELKANRWMPLPLA
jgi:hypothetical protein